MYDIIKYIQDISSELERLRMTGIGCNMSANNGGFGIQNNFLKNKTAGLQFNNKTGNTPSAYYAKKGEPMYMKEMDADEDGIVSLEEFKDYCEENNISVKEMIKMVELASSYRTMQAQKKASEESKKKNNSEEQVETKESEENVYARRGDGRYDEVMDTNNDDKVTYKEYIEYCKEHSNAKEQYSDTKVEQTEDNEFKTTSAGKAIDGYSRSESEECEHYVDDLG